MANEKPYTQTVANKVRFLICAVKCEKSVVIAYRGNDEINLFGDQNYVNILTEKNISCDFYQIGDPLATADCQP